MRNNTVWQLATDSTRHKPNLSSSAWNGWNLIQSDTAARQPSCCSRLQADAKTRRKTPGCESQMLFNRTERSLPQSQSLRQEMGLCFCVCVRACVCGQWTNSLIWLTVLCELGSTVGGEELQWDKLSVVRWSSDAPLTSAAPLRAFKMARLFFGRSRERQTWKETKRIR